MRQISKGEIVVCAKDKDKKKKRLTGKEATKIWFLANEILEDRFLPPMLLDLALVEAKKVAVISATAVEFLGGLVVVVAEGILSFLALLVSLQLVGFIVIVAALDVLGRGTGAVQRQQLMDKLSDRLATSLPR